MAEREELILEVEVEDGGAEADLRDIERAAENVEEAFEETGTAAERAGQAIVQAAEKAKSEMVAEKAAVDALANALGPELAAKADLTAVITDLQRMGLTLDDIRAEADTLAASLKQADSVRLQGLSQGVDITRRNMDGLRNSSDQSRSVLANLAGNASQDLGELGGVAGTAGVAIGQLAEYAVDGNIKLGQLAKVAGPMLGVAAAATLIGTAIKGIQAEKAFRAGLVEDFTDALREGADAAGTLLDRIQEAGELEFSDQGGLLGLGTETEDLIPVLNRLGLSFQDFMRLVQLSADGSEQAINDFLQELGQGTIGIGDFNADVDALADAVDQYGDAIKNAENAQDTFNDVILNTPDRVNQVNDALQQYNETQVETSELWDAVLGDLADNGAIDATTQSWNRLTQILGVTDEQLAEIANEKIAEQLEEQAKATGDFADATEEANEALREQNEALRETSLELEGTVDAFNQVTQRADAAAAAFERLNQKSELTSTQEVIGFADALNTLGDAIHQLAEHSDVELEGLDLVPDSWEEVMNMPEELRPVVDALSGFRDVMQTEFAQAFAHGGSPEAREWAENTRRAIIEELRQAGIEAPEHVNQILSALGLLPEQVEISIEATNATRAQGVLEDIASAISTLPTEVQLNIAAVAQEDPVAALQLAIDALEGAGVTVPAQLQILQDELEGQITDAATKKTWPTIQLPVELLLPDAGQKTDLASVLGMDVDAVTITPVADMTEYEDVVDDSVSEEREATVDVVADLSAFEADVNASVATERTADVDVNALLGGFESEMAFAVRDRSVTVNVGTGSVSIPSASQLISLATGGQGRIIVPIVGRWSTRIEGSRPGP